METSSLAKQGNAVAGVLRILAETAGRQARESAADPAGGPLEETAARLRAAALVEEHAGGAGRCNFGACLEKLLIALRREHEAGAIGIELHAPDLPISGAAVLPAALFVHEAVSNAVRHAFPNGRAGMVVVSASRHASETVIMISDDGVGLPAHVDPRREHTAGVRLMRLLAQEIHGEIDVAVDGGTQITLRIPDHWQANA